MRSPRVERRGLRGLLPGACGAHLEAGARGRAARRRPKPGRPRARARPPRLLANNATRAPRRAPKPRAARARSRAIWATGCSGEARDAGSRLAALARALPSRRAPVCLVAGGETTVTVRGPGRGGRSQELALAAALALAASRARRCSPRAPTAATAPPTAAGAFADGGTRRARRARPASTRAAALDANDSHAFFAREGGLFVTGPTART